MNADVMPFFKNISHQIIMLIVEKLENASKQRQDYP